MALINCYECGREISDRATYCPHCGCPIEETHTEEKQTFATLKIQRESKGLFAPLNMKFCLTMKSYVFWEAEKAQANMCLAVNIT